jgi:shikimate kinase
MNIALFGFMGVGKTVVGKAIASKTELEFVDLDDVIIKRMNKSISDIFKEDGESRFRQIEREITKETASRDKQVIALGGGTILDEENLKQLKKNSKLILLTADPSIILKRILSDGLVRPLLNVEDKLERIRALLYVRLPIYFEAADYVVDTSEGSPKEISAEIIDCLRGLITCI